MRRISRVVPVCLGGVFLLAGPVRAGADQAEMAFNLMFSADVARVGATPTLQDDAQLAERFLIESDNPRLAGPLRLRLAEKAYAFGTKDPVGYDHAAAAIERLRTMTPDRTQALNDMALELATLRFERASAAEREPDPLIDQHMGVGWARMKQGKPGEALPYFERALTIATQYQPQRSDEIALAVRQATRLMAVNERERQLRAAVAANPDDSQQRNALLRLLIVELDSPHAAAKELHDQADAELARAITLADKPLRDLAEADALWLAGWYRQQADDPGCTNVDGVLIRVKLYLSDFMLKHAVEDEARLRVKHELRQVDDRLAQLGVTSKVARKRVAHLAGGGRGHRDPKIDAAIDKGVAWLYQKMDGQRFWEGADPKPSDRNYGGYSAIAVYALLMAEEDPHARRELDRAVQFVFSRELIGTYAICFRLHAWELLPDRLRYQAVANKDAAWLRQAQTPEGFFDYTRDAARPPRRDMSATLAGGLGFWLSQEVAQIEVPQALWRRLAQACMDGQQSDGGWAYKGQTPDVSYGSMTCAGLTCLLVARDHLPDDMRPQADAAIERGLAWLDAQFRPDANPIKNQWLYYYLAAVQHVGLLSGQRVFNGQDWYSAAADVIVRNQSADGSWGNVADTSFAIAFLTRGGVHYAESYRGRE